MKHRLGEQQVGPMEERRECDGDMGKLERDCQLHPRAQVAF